MWLIENLTGIGVALLAIIAVVAGAFGVGKSKGKATAETQAKVEKVEAENLAIKDIAERETKVTKEAAHVQDTVNRLPDSSVDDQLREKWKYPDDTGGH